MAKSSDVLSKIMGARIVAYEKAAYVPTGANSGACSSDARGNPNTIDVLVIEQEGLPYQDFMKLYGESRIDSIRQKVAQRLFQKRGTETYYVILGGEDFKGEASIYNKRFLNIARNRDFINISVLNMDEAICKNLEDRLGQG